MDMWTLVSVLAWVACAAIAGYLVFDVIRVERGASRPTGADR